MLPFSLVAQLTLYPIQQRSQQSNARTHSLTPMKLPFWDDLSSPVNTDTLWEHKSTVWINGGLGVEPPTINVATFDGIDANGVPYSSNPNQSLDYGLTDSLVSRRIKMTDIPLFQRNSVFLSFYYQWGGNGETPDLNDFLRLEFFTNAGIWETVLTLQSSAVQSPTAFYGSTIRINQDKFYHDNFQFRFRSSGRKSGRYDTWNIDYIYMNKGRNENDLQQGFPDRAPNQSLTTLFDKYYAIPHRHFKTDVNANTGFPNFGIHNLSSIPQPMNYNIDASIKHYTNGVLSTQAMAIASAQPILPTVIGFEKRKLTFTTKPDLSSYTTVDSLFITLITTLITGDSVNTGFEPLNFYMNDTIQQAYSLKDYYAYDDGSAEYAIGLTQSGNLAAYRFVLKTGTADTVNGVYVHYPFTAGTSATTTTFMIWSNKNGKPGQLLLEELVPVQPKANNQFILREFIQSAVVKDTFFIGWKQPTAGRVQIGLDASQNTGSHLFANVKGAWEQTTLINGSAMIRPRFGKGNVVTGIEHSTSSVEIFPNPNSGIFSMRGELSQLQIISLTGQPVPYDTEVFGEETRIHVLTVVSGLYIVRYRSGNKFFTEKLIIRK